jgi:O-antigen/teichoic acid export membrane protein
MQIAAKCTVEKSFLYLLIRLLIPQDFGLLAMAAVFTGFINTMSKLGLAVALIYG